MPKLPSFLLAALAGLSLGCGKKVPEPDRGPAPPEPKREAPPPGWEVGPAEVGPGADPAHVRAVEAIRSGTEKERGAAAEELRRAGPAARPVAASLCELATRPDRRVDALLALESVAPELFGPVRTLLTTDNDWEEQRAAAALGELGERGRPAAVVLRWHIDHRSKRTPAKPPGAQQITADLSALVKVAPGSAETLKVLTAYLTFNADYPSHPLGPAFARQPTRALHEHAVALLGAVADAVPARRADVAAVLIPLLDGAELKLAALRALPACVEKAAPAKDKLTRLRFDPSEDVKRAADAALAAVNKAEQAVVAVVGAGSAAALAARAFDPEPATRKLAREELRKLHPALEACAASLGEANYTEADPRNHVAALEALKPLGPPHDEAVAYLLAAYLKHAATIPLGPAYSRYGPGYDSRYLLERTAGAAMVRFGPRLEVTRKVLLALSERTAASKFGEAIKLEEEIVWFGDELAANFPNDATVRKLILDEGRKAFPAGAGDHAPAVRLAFSTRVVRSLGVLAAARPDLRREIAELLGKVAVGYRYATGTFNARTGSGTDPDVLGDALIACGADAVPVIEDVKKSRAYRSGTTTDCQRAIDRAAAKLLKPAPK